MLDLPLIWSGIIAFSVFMYVLLDGFDLGVGILFPFAHNRAERDVMMNSIAGRPGRALADPGRGVSQRRLHPVQGVAPRRQGDRRIR